MIMDERLEFADATALDTSGTDTDLIGDVIDLGAASDVGNGQPIYLVIQVDTTVTSAGAATVAFKLASDAQAAIATDGSATVHYSSDAVKNSTLTTDMAGGTMQTSWGGIPIRRCDALRGNEATVA